MTKLVFGFDGCHFYQKAKENFDESIFVDLTKEELKRIKKMQGVQDKHISPLVFRINKVPTYKPTYYFIKRFLVNKVNTAEYCEGGYNGNLNPHTKRNSHTTYRA